MTFADELKGEIATEYLRRGDELGWRLLYSPATVLDGAAIALIGLNPAGHRDYPEHPSFACAAGTSAYASESWDGPPGESHLQRQVRLLFSHMRVGASEVLAGNLVPFRSPDWKSLRFKSEAMEFGEAIWQRILERARPRIVVTMGRESTRAVQRLLGIGAIESVRTGWGETTASRGTNGTAQLIGLPHLSRFRLFGRAESREPLKAILATR